MKDMEYKFLICQDPMISDDELIFHVNHPRILMRVEFMEDSDDHFNSSIGAIAFHDGDQYFIQPVQLIDKLDTNTEETARLLSKIMSDCGDWYVRLLEYEEQVNERLKDELSRTN